MRTLATLALAFGITVQAVASVQYGTFLGGSEEVRPRVFAVDNEGSVYISGSSFGLDFPVTTEPPFQLKGTFVAKIDPSIAGPQGLRYSASVSNLPPSFLEVGPNGLLYVVTGDAVGVAPTSPYALMPTLSGVSDMHVMILDLNRPGDGILRYGSYLGGSGGDHLKIARIDPQGRLVILGKTTSIDLPLTENAFDRTCGSGSCDSQSSWLVVVDPNKGGSAGLVYSTYLDFLPSQMQVDGKGRIHLASNAREQGIPVRNGFQSDCRQPAGKPCSDVYYALIDPSRSVEESFVFGTYFGGTDGDSVSGLAIDFTGHPWLIGSTSSIDLPATVGAVSPDCASDEIRCRQQVFVTRLEPEHAGAESVGFSMRFGGSGGDSAFGVAIDEAGRLAIVGTTESRDFPTTHSAYQRYSTAGPGCCGSDFFVVIVDPDEASPMRYATRVGGSTGEWYPHIETDTRVFVDDLGRVTFFALTTSPDFPTTPGASDRAEIRVDSHRNRNVVVTIDPSKSGSESLAYSSFVGGEASSVMRAFEKNGKYYLAGTTREPHFPTTPDAIDRTCGFGAVAFDGTCKANAFVAVMDSEPGPTLQTDRSVIGVGYAVPAPLPANEFVEVSTSDPGLRIQAMAESDEDWLQVAPAELTGGGPLEVTVDPSHLSPGRFSGRILLQSEDPFLRRSVAVQLVVAWPPPGDLTGIVNAASFLPGPVAPGQLVSIFGRGLGPIGGVGPETQPRVIGEIPGIEVQVEGGGYRGAPIVFASYGQINAVVPYEVDGQRTVVFSVRTSAGTSLKLVLPVAPSAPGLFTATGTGKGQALAVNEDGSLNSEDNPAQAGSIIVLYGTGEGQTEPRGYTGLLGSSPPRRPVLPVSASVGGQPAEILFAGAAPGFAGLLQVNIRLSSETPAGNSEIWIRIGGARSQANVTVAVE